MHGSNADGGIAGFASITIKRDGNFYGWHYASAADQLRLRTKNKNISDNKWHHIAFTRYGSPANGIYTAYIDGQVAARSSSWDCLCFVADQTNIYIANARARGTLVGESWWMMSDFLPSGSVSMKSARSTRMDSIRLSGRCRWTRRRKLLRLGRESKKANNEWRKTAKGIRYAG